MSGNHMTICEGGDELPTKKNESTIPQRLVRGKDFFLKKKKRERRK
jgi:hypothetical protein